MFGTRFDDRHRKLGIPLEDRCRRRDAACTPADNDNVIAGGGAIGRGAIRAAGRCGLDPAAQLRQVIARRICRAQDGCGRARSSLGQCPKRRGTGAGPAESESGAIGRCQRIAKGHNRCVVEIATADGNVTIGNAERVSLCLQVG